jgi:hypothetical protein
VGRDNLKKQKETCETSIWPQLKSEKLDCKGQINRDKQDRQESLRA